MNKKALVSIIVPVYNVEKYLRRALLSVENQTFENISKMFNSQFNLESKTKAINAIIILLKDNLLNISQRIICYFILYNISKSISHYYS